MAAKACILCGAVPPPPLTAEHIWPDWYNRQQPSFRYELESEFNGAVSVRPTSAMDLKPRVLCDPCNSEWGSDLEKRVAPILTPMMRGEPQRLGGREAQLVSAWFFLKAMVSEYLIPAGVRERQFFEPNDGRLLKTTLRPRDGTRVWIGQYLGTRSDAGWITDRTSARQVSDDPPAGVFWHSVTYSIGQLLLHLFSVSRPIPLKPLRNDEEAPTIRFTIPWTPGDWTTALSPIWPPPSAPISWPPQKAFDDDGFIYLADRWNPQESPSPEPPAEISHSTE